MEAQGCGKVPVLCQAEQKKEQNWLSQKVYKCIIAVIGLAEF